MKNKTIDKAASSESQLPLQGLPAARGGLPAVATLEDVRRLEELEERVRRLEGELTTLFDARRSRCG